MPSWHGQDNFFTHEDIHTCNYLEMDKCLCVCVRVCMYVCVCVYIYILFCLPLLFKYRHNVVEVRCHIQYWTWF